MVVKVLGDVMQVHIWILILSQSKQDIIDLRIIVDYDKLDRTHGIYYWHYISRKETNHCLKPGRAFEFNSIVALYYVFRDNSEKYLPTKWIRLCIACIYYKLTCNNKSSLCVIIQNNINISVSKCLIFCLTHS